MAGKFRYKLALIKTFSWELVSTPVTLLLVYLFTGKYGTMLLGSFALAHICIKLLLYMAHERVWHAVFKRNERCAARITRDTGD